MMTNSLTQGFLYHLINDVKIGNTLLRKGLNVVYTSGGYSPYDDCYIYQFMNSLGENIICVSLLELTTDDVKNFQRVDTLSDIK